MLKRDVITGTLSQDMTHATVKLRVTISSHVGQYECFVTTDICLFLPQTVFFFTPLSALHRVSVLYVHCLLVRVILLGLMPASLETSQLVEVSFYLRV